jgi:anti-anti-sigma factor
MDVSVTREQGVPVAAVRGEVDASNAGEVARALHDAVPNASFGLVLDLTAVTYLDSAGIQMLFDTVLRLDRRQQRLHLVVPPGSFVEDVMLSTNLAGVVDIDQDARSAIAHLRGGGEPPQPPGPRPQ